MVNDVLFRHAMSLFPAGVTVVTTVDAEGRWWGFTASSFSSLSLEPPQILVCLARDADCHPIFTTHDRFAVNILKHAQEDVARRFARRGHDKFEGVAFSLSDCGLPLLDDALATVECSTLGTIDGGDHTILVGGVVSALVSDGEPAVYFDRRFHRLDATGIRPRSVGG